MPAASRKDRGALRRRRPAASTAAPEEPVSTDWAFYFYLCGDYPDLATEIETNLQQILSAANETGLAIAVQRDRKEGCTRIARAIGAAIREDLGAVNTGDSAALTRFLCWAQEKCPAEHAALVIGGMGLFQGLASPESRSWNHLFSICDDESNDDAMDIHDLATALQTFVASSRGGRPLDLLAFDVCDMQFLEVAYELEGVANVLAAPQTAIPAAGIAYDRLLHAWHGLVTDKTAGGQHDGRAFGATFAEVAAASYAESSRPIAARSEDQGGCRVSAVDLRQLAAVTESFDSFLVAMTQYLGNDLVWQVREDALETLQPDRTLRVWSYDLFDLLRIVSDTACRTSQFPAIRWFAYKLVQMRGTNRLKSRWFEELQRRLRDASEPGGARPNRPPPAWADELSKFLETIAAEGLQERDLELKALLAGEDDVVPKQDLEAVLEALHPKPNLLQQLLTARAPDPERDALALWLEETLRSVLKQMRAIVLPDLRLPDDLGDELDQLPEQQANVERIWKLAERACRTVAAPAQPDGSDFVIAVRQSAAVERDERPRSGVSIFRPRDIDELRDLGYIELRFHQSVHWAAYLGAVSLIKTHPTALWRLVSGLLATSSPAARSDMQRRLIGPESMLVGFGRQLRVLTPPTCVQLTLDRRVERIAPVNGSAGSRDALFYWLRLESNQAGATIIEQRSRVQETSIHAALDGLDAILGKAWLERSDALAFESIGRSLGEDIIQDLDEPLTRLIRKQARELQQEGAAPDDEPVHLQLQLPRELMRYPWELLHDGDGWLGERFAVARAAFMETGVARSSPARGGDPLRILIVGDPLLDDALRIDGARVPQLPGARAEAEKIAEEFERLAACLDGVVDFDRDRDVRVGKRTTAQDLRTLLRPLAPGAVRYDIVHFAGHARFDEVEPAMSSWLLSDGELTALQIRSMLRRIERPPWLVYASACQSSMESVAQPVYQRGVYGLATAFISSGVAAYLGPLWPIDDGIAAQIAIDFYATLVRDRRSLGTALWRAKRTARDTVYGPRGEGGWNPLAAGIGLGWASIALYGDPTATIGQLLGPKPPRPSSRRRLRPPIRQASPTASWSGRAGLAHDSVSSTVGTVAGPGMDPVALTRSIRMARGELVLELAEQSGIRFWQVRRDENVSALPNSKLSGSAASQEMRDLLGVQRGWRDAAHVIGRWALHRADGEQFAGLAAEHDREIVPREGLQRLVDANGRWIPYDGPLPYEPGGGAGRVLLFCHGAFSNTRGMVADLGSDFFEWALRRYALVLGADHWSLSKSPEANAADIHGWMRCDLPAAPGRIDAIAHSRGGLVVRTLAELHDPSLPSALRRVALVSTPNSGTQLADPAKWGRAADLLVNWVGIDPSRVLGRLAGFLAQMAARNVVGGIPGLQAMDPGGCAKPHSLLGRLLAATPKAGVQYAAVGVDYAPSRDSLCALDRIKRSAKGAAADFLIFSKEANDLVVDTESEWKLRSGSDAPLGPALDPARLLAILSDGTEPRGARTANIEGIHHNNVLGSAVVRRFLIEQLA